MKDPFYYGRARQVNEGFKLDFQYLEDYTYSDLDEIATYAFMNEEVNLERAASSLLKKKYLEGVKLWGEEVTERDKDIGDNNYLNQCNEIIRLGFNNHKGLLIEIWPYIRERADILNTNLRMKKTLARLKYDYNRKMLESLICDGAKK